MARARDGPAQRDPVARGNGQAGLRDARPAEPPGEGRNRPNPVSGEAQRTAVSVSQGHGQADQQGSGARMASQGRGACRTATHERHLLARVPQALGHETEAPALARYRCTGGWKDLRNVQENYMQPDDETKLRVVLWE